MAWNRCFVLCCSIDDVALCFISLILIFSSAGSAYQISHQNVVCVFECEPWWISRNRCTQVLVLLHALTYRWTLIRNQNTGRPDLLYWVLGYHKNYLCIICESYWHTVTKCALQVHLRPMHQLAFSRPVWPFFLESQGSKCKTINFGGNYSGRNHKRCTERLVILHVQIY